MVKNPKHGQLPESPTKRRLPTTLATVSQLSDTRSPYASSGKKMSRSKLKSSELSPSHSQVPGEFGHEAEAQSSSRFDDEMTRLNNLNLINASARYDLLHVNQQLIDFKIG